MKLQLPKVVLQKILQSLILLKSALQYLRPLLAESS
jgi:hypothetical protein